MKNSIYAGISFSYKGEDFSPSATIDLDAMMEKGGELSNMYSFLAREHHIDTYSYLYEVMEAHEIEYSDPTGLAEKCFVDGVFDVERFEQLWNEQQQLVVLGDIAKRYLKIDDLEQHPDLKAALLAAYHAAIP